MGSGIRKVTGTGSLNPLIWMSSCYVFLVQHRENGGRIHRTNMISREPVTLWIASWMETTGIVDESSVWSEIGFGMRMRMFMEIVPGTESETMGLLERHKYLSPNTNTKTAGLAAGSHSFILFTSGSYLLVLPRVSS